MVVTEDLAKFGQRELEEAKDLLTAYLENNKTKILEDSKVRLCFNMDSGNVFLSDENYNVGVVVEKRHLIEKGRDDYPEVIYKRN